MKRINYIVLPAMLLLLSAAGSQAQQKRFDLELNYSISGPTGQFADFVNRSSFNGWQANLMYKLNDHVSVGFGTGFQDYYEKYPRQVYKMSDGSDISAVVTNSVQTIPLLVKGRYQFLPNGKWQPYAGLGLGGNMVLFNQYLGQFSNAHNDFGFAASPEAGLFIPLGKSGQTGINLEGQYNIMPYNKNGLNNLNNWSAGAGIRLALK